MSIFGGEERFTEAGRVRPGATPGPIYSLPSTMRMSPRYDLAKRKNVALFTTLRGQHSRPATRGGTDSGLSGLMEPTPPPAAAGAGAGSDTAAGATGGRPGGMSPEAAATLAAAEAFVDPEQAVRDAIARAESGQQQRAEDDKQRAAEREALHRSVARPGTARTDDAAPVHTRAEIQRWLNETKDAAAMHAARIAHAPSATAAATHGSQSARTPVPPPPGTRRLKDMNRADWLETNPNRVSEGLSPAKYEPAYYSDSRHARPPTATLVMSGRNVEWRLKWQDGLPGPKYDPDNAEQKTSKYKAPPSLASMFAPEVGSGGDRLHLLTTGTIRNGLLAHGHHATSEVGPGAYDVPAVNPGARAAPAPSIASRTDTSQLYISKKHNLTERYGVCSPGALYDVTHYDVSSRTKPVEHIIRPKYQLPDADTIASEDAHQHKHLRALATTLKTHHENKVDRDLRRAHAALERDRKEQMHPGVTLNGTPAVAGAIARAEAAAKAAATPYEYDPRAIPGLMNTGYDDLDELKMSDEEKAERKAKRDAEQAAAKAKAEQAELLKLRQQSPRRKSHVQFQVRRVNQWKKDAHGRATSRDSWLHGTVTKRPSTAPGGSSGMMVERHFYAQHYSPGPGAYDTSGHHANFGNTQSFNAAARYSRARKERKLRRMGTTGGGKPALFAPQHLPSSARHHKLLKQAAAQGANASEAEFVARSASFPTYSQLTAKKLADAIAREQATRAQHKHEQALAQAALRRAQAAQLEQHPALLSPAQREQVLAAKHNHQQMLVTSEHTFDADLEEALAGPRAGGGEEEKTTGGGGGQGRAPTDDLNRSVSFAAASSVVAAANAGASDRIRPHQSRPSPTRKLSKPPTHVAEGDSGSASAPAAASAVSTLIPSPPAKPNPFGYSAAQMPQPKIASKPAQAQFYVARSPRASANAVGSPRVHMSPRPVLFVPRTYDGAAGGVSGTPRAATAAAIDSTAAGSQTTR